MPYRHTTVYSERFREIHRFRRLSGNKGSRAPALMIAPKCTGDPNRPFFYCHAPQLPTISPRCRCRIHLVSLSCEIFAEGHLGQPSSEPLLTVQHPLNLLVCTTSVKSRRKQVLCNFKQILLYELNPSPLQWSEFETKCADECH